MPEIFSYDSYVLVFPITIDSTNDGFRVKHPISGTGFSTFFTNSPSIMWKNSTSGVITCLSLLGQLQANLVAAYNALYSNTDGNFDVTLNEWLKIVITNNSPDDLNVDFASAVTDAKTILGFGNETGAVSIAGGGGVLTATYQAFGLWSPFFHYWRDTAHDTKTIRRKSVTESGRPSYTRHSDEHKKRTISWKYVPAALIKESRVNDLTGLFSSDAGIVQGDPHCYLQKWLNYIMDESGPLPGCCFISNNKDETNSLDNAYGSGPVGSGPYYVDIPDDVLNGIDDAWLNQESAIESYDPTLNFLYRTA